MKQKYIEIYTAIVNVLIQGKKDINTQKQIFHYVIVIVLSHMTTTTTTNTTTTTDKNTFFYVYI